MKTKRDKSWRWLSLVAVIGLTGIFVFHLLTKNQEENLSDATLPKSGPANIDSSNSRTTDRMPVPESRRSISEETRQFLKEREKDPDMEWKMPLNFWGKVVDENDREIEGATIRFTWNDLSPEGTSNHQTLSDHHGLFSLNSRTGKGLSVDVEKQGFYPFPGSARKSFEYARPSERFHPDPNNPVIFRLKKAGKLEPLLAYFVGLPVSNTGEPTQFDFLAGKWAEPGAISFKCDLGASDEGTRKFDWTLRLAIPGGGLLVRTNALDFEAPVDGYVEQIELAAKQAEPDWQAGFKGSYFVKFDTPARFGRIEFQFIPQRIENYKTSAVHLKYWVNPSGSRNLEADPAKYLEEIPRHYLRTGLPPKRSVLE